MSADAISAAGDLLSGLGVCVGLFFAWQQLSSWKLQTISNKRAEVAEEALLAAYQFDDALRILRSRFKRYYLEEGETSDVAARRYLAERLKLLGERQADLRRAQIRARAVLDSDDLDKEIDILTDIAVETRLAHESLIEPVNRPMSIDERELVDIRRIAYGSYDEKDALGVRQIEALGRIKKILRPLIAHGESIK